jgi:aminoglycoside phosphotransferase (APT) family kinase protein
VDSYIGGEDGTIESVGAAAWSALGGLLAKLHRLPVDGLDGTAETRLQQAWPIHPDRLEAHPVAHAAPYLPPLLAPFRDAILAAAARPGGIAHGDPAAYNLRLEGGELAGLIDFNDVFVGPPALDMAWIAVYSGQAAAEATLSGYGEAGAAFLTDVRLLSIPVALHSIGRAALLGQPDRTARMVRSLDETLKALRS